MHDPLAPLLADGIIDEVVARLKSGKEADLWLVRHGGEIVAAKIYKERQARSFRNNAAYREGRQVRDTRMQRAMDRGSRFGQAAAEEAWKAKEADALYALHAAGVRVPKPVLFYQGVLLMEVVVDAEGRPAPRLVDAQIARADAAALYADLRSQAVRMLAADLIHGDLSPYNVLAGWNGPVVIDFPQVIGAAHNSQAQRFFQRDVENVRRFFAALDPALHAAAGDAAEIWRAYERRELRPDFVPSGRAPEAPRREAPRPHAASHGAPPRAQAGGPQRRQEGRPQEPRRHDQRRQEGRRQEPRAQEPRRPSGAPPRGGPGPEVIRVSRPAQHTHPESQPQHPHPQQQPLRSQPQHPRAQPQHAQHPHPRPPPGAHAAPPAAAPGSGHRRRRRRGPR
ncbi:RIO1 family regulatory kinase/ATPase domain-containing protein [Anaeromyxobacter diazotrophicus]|nr:RIO1 family regulatory kinase/ATPase [Anaeromyxobacter diazotrophicus]